MCNRHLKRYMDIYYSHQNIICVKVEIGLHYRTEDDKTGSGSEVEKYFSS